MPIIIEEINVEIVPEEQPAGGEPTPPPLPAEAHGSIEIISLLKLSQERKARLDFD